ncbi:MAG: ATP-binding cassette domain-containing protein [Candidatus Thorarchaeota archaeon]|nr:ATP-binding cassette domain-containing protein [Candidatus Thorarchaeota archaeon]
MEVIVEQSFKKTKKTAIELKNLTKRFGNLTAVDGLFLDIRWGEIFGLLGPNGAGKTTTVNILSTLLDPTEGYATVAGHDVVEKASEVRKVIGLCPQEPAYFPYLTGRENIELFGQLHSVPQKLLGERIENLAQRVDIHDDIDRRASHYSGGMIRRISTIMALIHDPPVALLDEPTVAMDPISRRSVWDFIKELRSQNKTIILTTHYMEEAQELSDRVGIIDEGRLIEVGPPQDLIDKYQVNDLEDVFVLRTGKKLKEEV